MPSYDIIAWEPWLSPHKTYFYRQVQLHRQVNTVRYIADRPLSDDRRRQGWDGEAPDGLDVAIAPSDDEIEDIIQRCPEDAVHILSGFRGFRTLEVALRSLLRHGRRFAIQQEPRVLDDWRGPVRLAQSLLTEGDIRKHAEFILAIGRNGPRWFRLAGYDRERIFPFAYFVPAPRASEPQRVRVEEVRVAYVGRLERLKGVHLLLGALPQIEDGIEIHIAGVGALDADVRAAAATDARVSFHGRLAMHEVHAFLSGMDILVAPSISEDDGWGVVVSEALMSGCSVLASHKVGASICLDHPSRGQVLNTLTSEALALGLNNLARDRRRHPAPKAPIQSWAHERLTDKAGASTLLNIIDLVRNRAPRGSVFVSPFLTEQGSSPP